MAGTVLRVLPLRSFTFTDLRDIKTLKITVAHQLDVSKHSGGDLVVRLHSATIPSFPARLTVRVVQDLATVEDPTTEFFGDSVAEVSFESSDSAESVRIAALDDNPMGPMIG